MKTNNNDTVTLSLKFPGMDISFWVQKEFLSVVPEPWNNGKLSPQEHFIELLTKHKMANFLHNLKGPAVVNHETKIEQFLINGKKIVDQAIIDKMKHDAGFEEKFIDELTKNNEQK